MTLEISEIINHLGENRDRYFEAVAPPIIQSSNFLFRSIEDMQHKMACEFDSHVYTRGNNPTVAMLRKKIAALEGCEEALIFSSGAGAVAASVISVLKQGDHAICVAKPYGWTRKLFVQLLDRFGVEVSFVDGTNVKNFEEAAKSTTKLIYLESPNSWTFELQDIAAVSKLARTRGITSIIDNSHATPLSQQPHKLGIDLVLHSATKYISGHSDVVAGALCGSRQQIEHIFNHEYMTLGACTSAHDASLLLRGLRTLPLRLEQSTRSANKLCEVLLKHPKIKKIIYPHHPSHPQYELAKRQMSHAGGLLTIEVDSEKTVHDFAAKTKAFLMGVSWGGYESLFLPALGLKGNTSGQLPPGLNTKMIRLYVGLEEVEYLAKDLVASLG